MFKKKPDKKISYLEVSFSDILVCQKKDARPYMEVFVQKPENASHNNLGIIAGILEITDDSEDSSYVVNYLTSVIKKEYYSKTKRDPIESFEAALKKANLALSKLAEHENISWIGKINAVLLVVEKNNIHLATAGNAHALLIRKNLLTNINENTEAQEAPNPLKTFVDVLSGRLEKDDKLVITTRHIFDVFSSEEIKRSALKFSSPEFIQFLKTALGNELDRSAVLVVEAQEKEKLEMAPQFQKKSAKVNAFSQTAFSKIPSRQAVPKVSANEKEAASFIDSEEKQNLVNGIKEDLARENGEFVDKKTGHIYIKEDLFLEKKPGLDNFLENIRVKFSAVFSSVPKIFSGLIGNFSSLRLPQISFKFFQKTSRPDTIEEAVEEENPIPEAPKEIPKESKINQTSKLFFQSLALFLIFSKKTWNKFYPWLRSRSIALMFFSFRAIRIFLSSLKIFLIQRKNSLKAKKAVRLSAESPAVNLENTPFAVGKFLPNFSRIKNIFSKFDYSQKLYAILAVISLFVLPYFISKLWSKDPEKTPPVQESEVKIALPLEQDKNVIRIEKLNQTELEKEMSDVLNLNGKIFAIGSHEIINLENKASYPFPDGFTSPKKVSGMDDLNLLFLLGANNKIISWSPANGKFQDNSITVPDGAEIECAETYLTYLYLLDKKNNQIYRYPRANGGFGEKTDWLKDSVNLGQVQEMAISEDIFLSQPDGIIRLSRGKKRDFQIEKTATPIAADEIYAKRNSQNIYVLDKTNSRIIKLDLNGSILSQYHNPEIKNAADFAVDEEKNAIYFSASSEVKSFQAK